MKKLLLLTCLIAGLMSLNAQTLIQKFYFDFGLAADTTKFDASGNNGNYWNNYTGVNNTFQTRKLVNSSNVVSNYNLYPKNRTPTYKLDGVNGPAFGPATNTTALGDLGIASATTSTMYSNVSGSTGGQLTFNGLNPAKRYKFYIFGSRKDTYRVTRYTLTGTSTFTDTLTVGYATANANSGNASGVGVTYNNTRIVQSGLIYPKSDSITLALSMFSGSICYINCMKMEEYKGTQTITFGALTSKVTSDGNYSPGASASSSLAISYASSNSAVATIVANQIHIVGVGTTTITASQAGDATYEAATSVPQTLTVSASSLTAQSITFGSLSAKTVGDAAFDILATASSGLAVSFSSSNTAVATVSGSTVTIVGGGTTDITATQAGDATYAGASNIIQTLTVNKLSQTITFGTLSAKSSTDAAYSISATSTSGLAVTFTSSNTSVATVAGNTVTIVGAGTTNIIAAQVGNATYSAAATVSQALTVNAATVSQSFLFDFGSSDTANGDETLGADVNGKYWNNISNATANTAITGTFGALKNTSNTASSYSLVFQDSKFKTNGKGAGGLLTPYSPALPSEFAIATATEDYIFTSGTTLATGAVLKMTGLNPLAQYRFKLFSSRNYPLDALTTYTVQGAGTALTGYLSAATAAGMGGTVYINSATNYGATAPATLNVSYTLSSTGSNTQSVTYYGNNKSYITSALFYPTPAGEISITTYSASAYAFINLMKMEEFKVTQTITFGALAIKAVGDIDYTPTASASSGLALSYVSSNAAVATIEAGKIHIVGVGTSTITASQAGNANYEAATSATQTLTVTSLTSQLITFNALPVKTVADASFGLTASSNSGLSVSFTSSNTSVATVAGSTVTIIAAGTTDITASQAGDATYAAATNIIQTLTVNKLDQTITFGALSAKTDADASYNLSATSTSGLALTYTSSNTSVAQVVGNTVTIVSAGTTNITASQAGNTTYSVATSVTQALTVSAVLIVKQNFFFDFGPSDGTNGDLTTNPDVNTNYWNNINSLGGTLRTPFSLINSANAPTSYALQFTSDGSSAFTSNGKLNGGLLSPTALGEFNVASATEDYMFTTASANGPVITISGLNKAKRYKFKIFGCRNANNNRTSQYTIQGAGPAIVGSLATSAVAPGLGGNVFIDASLLPTNTNASYTLTSTGSNTQQVIYYGNNSSTYTSGLLAPDADGKITITTISTTTSAYAYINAMKMEEYYTSSTWSGTGNWSDQNPNWTASTTPVSGSEIAVTSGQLTIDQNAAVDKITLSPGAELKLASTKSLTLNSMILESNNSGTATFSNDNSSNTITISGDLKLYKTLDNTKWYFMSFPSEVVLNDIAKISGAQTMILGTNWWIKYYDGAGRATNLGAITNWKDMITGETLTANKGYAIGLDATLTGDYVLSFPLNTNLVSTAVVAKAVPVTAYGEGTPGLAANHIGWNLVGMPYLKKIVGANVGVNYMTFCNGSTYTQYSKAEVANIIPFNSFFIQASTAGSGSNLAFSLVAPLGIPSIIPTDSSDLIQLNITTASGTDKTNLIIDNNQSVAYEINQDLEKWLKIDTSTPQIYSQLSNVNYAYNALPISAVNNLPLGIYTQTAGTSTISATKTQISSLTKLLLKDNLTGTTTDLLSSDYTFTADAGTNNSRFSITAHRISTDIIQINNELAEVSVSNGKLSVSNLMSNTSVRVYDAIGRMVVNKMVKDNMLEIPLKTKGVYTIQLQSGKQCLTSKVIF